MKRGLLPLLGVLLGLGLGLSAQISSHTAYSFRSGASLPAACNPGPPITDLFYLTSGSTGLYVCTATNTWTIVSGGGGGGVTTLQIDSNSALAGAVQLLSGTGLSSSCASGGTTSPCTFTVNQATAVQLGILALTGDFGGSASSPTVVGLHFGSNHVATSSSAPTNDAPLCVDSGTLGTANCTGGYTAQTWQDGAFGNSNVTVLSGGNMALWSTEIKTPLSAANFVFQVTTADGAHNLGVCLYGPFTSAGVSTPLAASITAATYGSTGTEIVPIAGGATVLPAGVYFVGFNMAASFTGNLNAILPPFELTQYFNASFATGQTGTCPATITAPTLATTVTTPPPFFAITKQ